MNLGDLIDAAREELDDTVVPYIWSDFLLIKAANEGEREACRRARLLIDSTTPLDADDNPLCQYPVTAGNALITLHPKVVAVKRAKLASRSLILDKYVLKEMDERVGWEAHTGTVDGWITDYTTGKMRLYRVPIVDDTLNLTVSRLPLSDMSKFTDAPEIHERFHDALVHWMCYRAYLKKDTERYDKSEGLEKLALFEQEFGPKRDALNEVYEERNYGFDSLDGSY